MLKNENINVLIVSSYNKNFVNTCINSIMCSTQNAHIYVIDNSKSIEDLLDPNDYFPNVTIIDNHNKKLFDVQKLFEIDQNYGSIEHAYSVQYFINNYKIPFVLLDSDTIVKTDLHGLISDTNLIAIGNLSEDLHPRLTPACVYINSQKLIDNNLQFLDINKIKPNNITYSTGASFYEEILSKGLIDEIITDANIALYIEHLWGGSQNSAFSGCYVSKDLSFIDWNHTISAKEAKKKRYQKFDYQKYVSKFFEINDKYSNIVLYRNAEKVLNTILTSLQYIKDPVITTKTTIEDVLKESYNLSDKQLFIIFQLYIYTVIFKLIYDKDTYDLQQFAHAHPIYDFIHQIFKDEDNYEQICYFLRNWIKSTYDNEVRSLLIDFGNINLDKAITNYYNGIIDYKFLDIINKYAIQYFQKLKTFKARRLKYLIGTGWEGGVFELGHGVIKVYFRKIKSLTKEFLNNKHLKFFPKIYHYSKYIVCEEKVKIKTPKCIKYVSLLSCYPEESAGSYYKIIRKDRSFYKNCKLSQEEKDILQWGTELFNINLRKKHHNNFYDVNVDNIGERENGDIVLFDP